MFELIFLIAVSLYFLQSFIFMTGANKSYPRIKDTALPTASVIVAARNEEDNIVRCLESLSHLVYPEGKLEIIIADDASTDSTAELVKEFIKDKPCFKYLYIDNKIAHLKGKTNALANAIKIANGEIILTTDADCAVPPTWAKALTSYYRNDIGLVCGYTTQKAVNNFTGMQALDFMYLLTVAAGSMNLNMPLSCIGNNMSFRRSAYLEAGGYEGLPFSVTEDFNLLAAIHKKTKYRVLYPLEDEALVESMPCQNMRSLYWQKKRWGVGGLDSELKGFIVMASGFIANVCILLTPLFFSAVSLYLLTFKICTDLFFLVPVLTKYGLRNKLKYFFSFQLYFIFYVIALPFIVLMDRKVVWKDREL